MIYDSKKVQTNCLKMISRVSVSISVALVISYFCFRMKYFM